MTKRWHVEYASRKSQQITVWESTSLRRSISSRPMQGLRRRTLATVPHSHPIKMGLPLAMRSCWTSVASVDVKETPDYGPQTVTCVLLTVDQCQQWQRSTGGGNGYVDGMAWKRTVTTMSQLASLGRITGYVRESTGVFQRHQKGTQVRPSQPTIGQPATQLARWKFTLLIKNSTTPPRPLKYVSAPVFTDVTPRYATSTISVQ